MSKVVIFDTNVLLADPNSVLSFPHAEVIIPETVLGELDKLKTARVDPDLRFRGREISRILFELGEEGSLIDGVDMPDGGRLRVATLDTDRGLPDGLSPRQSDDRILATAAQICAAEPDCDVTLITNDLNMLLKAQTLGIPVERYGDGTEGGFARRYIIRPFQRYKIPIGILSVAVAVFAAIIVIVLWIQPNQDAATGLPTEFRQLLSANQIDALNALTALQQNPTNDEALLAMGNYYFGLTEEARMTNDPASQLRWAQPGIRYYERYLKQADSDTEARSDYATLLFYAGQTDRAIQQVGIVLERAPDHINANYNLGIILLNGRRDYAGARDQFVKVVKLIGNNQEMHGTKIQAEALIKQIDKDLQSSSVSSETTQ